MAEAEIIGLLAGLLVALGLVPQILRIWKLRDAQEISLGFNLLYLVGTLLWLFYGLSLDLLSVVFWNGANAVLLVLLLIMKLKYGMVRTVPGARGSTSQESLGNNQA